jgi:holo-[acyl-carrier protein] synthase
MKKSKTTNYIGVGVDIEQTGRFINKKINSPLLKRIYTPEELCYCFNKSRPHESLAGRFAAKESVKKALAIFVKQSVDHKEIEIKINGSGVPLIYVKNKLGNKFNFSLSISHTKNMAIAFVIATLK